MQARRTLLIALSAAFAASCVDLGEGDDHGDEHDTEIISTVELTFTPMDGGAPVVAAFSDPDGDGGVSGTADAIVLSAGTEYTLDIALLNDLADPAVDIGAEVGDEAEEHMFFIVGDGVFGPGSAASTSLVTHAYADLESDYGDNLVGDDLPLGLRNSITADSPGAATFRVVLRHLPELNGTPQKRADLPQTLADGGALPGDVDVDVSFELTVN